MTKKDDDGRTTPRQELMPIGFNSPAGKDDDVRISLREWIMSQTVRGLRRQKQLTDAFSDFLESIYRCQVVEHRLKNISETLKRQDELDRIDHETQIERKENERERSQLEHDAEAARLKALKHEYEKGIKPPRGEKQEPPYNDIRDPKTREAVTRVASFFSRNIEGQEYLNEFEKKCDELVKEGKITEEQAGEMKQAMQEIYFRTIDEA